MEHLAQPQATLVDLLDRILDRGLLLNADIIISLAGVPLIGLNLRVALAGMDTMMKYGLLQEWDRNVRLESGVEEAFLVTEKSLSGIASTSLGN